MKDLYNKAKKDIDTIESSIEKFIGKEEHNCIQICDSFLSYLSKASSFVPVLINDLNNPLVKQISVLLGVGTLPERVISILNRVGPKLKLIADDKTLYNGAINHIAAEILVLVKNGQITADEAVLNIQKYFVPTENQI